MKKLSFIIVIIMLAALVSGCGAVPSTPTTTSTTTAKPPVTSTTTIAATNPVSTPPATTKTTTPTPSPTTVSPPAQVSGTVYFRDPAVSFKVDADVSVYALSGATVNVGGYNIVSGADGKYTIPCPAGFQTVTVTAEGFIPTRVSWTFKSGQSYNFDLGLYRTPQTVTPRPDFINGIITWDAGGWLIDYYYQKGLFQPTYTNIVDKAGGNLVTVSDPLFIKEVDANHVVMSPTSIEGSFWRMMNETEYTALVQDAHSKGLDFMLWIGVMDEGKTDYNKIIYTDSPRTDAFWDDWFSEYEKYAVPCAQMAEKLGIEYISLGHDMSYATSKSRHSGGAPDCLARWKKLVSAIRAVYSGRLTYFGGMSSVWTFYEDNDYAPGFVDLFDAVGINIQDIGPTLNPSLNQLKAAVTALLDRYTAWPCPVFVMVRTPSVDGGTSFDTYIEPLLVVNQEAVKHNMNVWQQADIYEAFYEVVNDRPSGAGQVMGIFPWGYNYLDEYLFTPGKIDGYMAMDKSGNIRGKPAEAVLQFWGAFK
jgi:hypothetical protein